ncbi:transporter substrate-binding domain-containing protein [Stagnihabitans tardus]|uniref:Transporter substrate-binding domain-containing protein n=1 Tax=Stagnihabitans tardus TaxID=2699202 RepID=A0AAE5BR58_9RHOB|nr:transporter substrate-binding domain-containing protein [Stagnihabitans tardus]NBZ86180.1 transporter substrate-binding domain-containing protein [Stagnihabitans tardus]
MKKILLAAVATMALGTAAFAEPVKIGVAAEPYPPFTSPDASGNWVGWEVDFMNAICKQAQIECVITPTAWDGIIPALTSGQIDVIMSSMSITAERAQTIDFSDKYYNTPAMIVTAKGSGITPDAAGLTGKIIGVQVSTTHEAYTQKYFASVAAEVKTYQTLDEHNQDLAAGRVDAVMGDSIAMDAFLKSEAGMACCESVGAVADDAEILGAGVGFGLRKGDPLLPKLNEAIAAIRADGTYDAISKNYFDFDIYGK